MPLPLPLPVGLPVLFAAAVALSSVWTVSAKADDSEVLDATGQNWRAQAPQSGNFASQARQNAAPPGFVCPSGWNCAPATPKGQAAQAQDADCTSRFSRCARMQRGGAGGGDD